MRRSVRNTAALAAIAALAVPAAAITTWASGPALAQEAQETHPAGDPALGKQVFGKCAACHSIKLGENKVGPSMANIVGRPSHSIEGFNYSEPMKAYNVTWDVATLDHYLINPRETVPGTRMIFAGLKKDEDRANVIAYLETLKQ